MKAPKVHVTKNYDLFDRTDDNRPLDLSGHRSLEESMRDYGFLEHYPIGVSSGVGGRLIVKDGQHRLAIAQRLGLPIYYIVSDVEYDVARTNNAQKSWRVGDYAQKWADQGKVNYSQAIEFAEVNRLPIGLACALLAGTTTFHNIKEQFVAGDFVIKDRAWSETVVAVYTPLSLLNSRLRSPRLLQVCMALCRTPGFEPRRLLLNAEKYRDKLVQFSSIDGGLAMLDDVYNHNSKKPWPLKFEVAQAMKARTNLPPKQRGV